MARAAKLKVFRTPIGFHDAYVAAPSQKAAIEAWGSDRDLFARGEAELVSDPKLAAEPLANPGKVIKRLRGTAKEQIAALPPNRSRKAKPRKDEPRHAKASSARELSKPKAEPGPRPSRAKLDRAEAAIETARQKQRTQLERMRARQQALAQEKAAIERKQAAEIERLTDKADEARAAYEAALERWRAE
jgi:hypothetical protein